jgi:hypothetical protein
MNKVFLLAAALAAFAAPAFADPVTLNVNPGAAVPLGPVSHVTKTAFMIQGSAETPVAPSLAAGVEIGYTHPNSEGTAFFGSFTSDIHTTLWQVTPYVRYSLPSATTNWGSDLTPYAILGLGTYIDRRGSGSLTPNGGGAIAVPVSPTVTHFGFNVGIGASLGLSKTVALGIDFRYHMYFTKRDIDLDSATSLDHEPIYFIVPSLRISYKFGQ